jgi:ABC-type Mn2+/Zn2+ transport system permease subunit
MNSIDILEYDFIQRALIVWSILAIVFALFGNVVVLRKWANIAHTISHFALLGIAGWLVANINWYVSMLFFLSLGIGIMYMLQKKWFFADDAINEILAQIGLVGAILFFAQATWYIWSIEQYLFGDILLITQSDVYITLILWTIVSTMFVFFMKPLLATSFNPKISKVYNINTHIINFFYIVFLSVVIGMSIKIVWVLLVTAFIVLAPNIMKIIAKNIKQMIIWSLCINSMAVVWWLIMSYIFNIPSGIGIVAILLSLLLVVSILSKKKHYQK